MLIVIAGVVANRDGRGSENEGDDKMVKIKIDVLAE